MNGRKTCLRWRSLGLGGLGLLLSVSPVLSFEMGLLWPRLMGRFGSAYGIPFAVEGIFFFLEAIFAGIYLWGWRRLPGWAHWWSGMPIAVSGCVWWLWSVQ